jgi:predicted transglutaminase-like cysteine proteinase
MVRAGYLKAQELRRALSLQAQAGRPLGQILIESGLVSRPQLARVLVKQHTLRSLVALCFVLGPLTVSSKKASADIKELPAGISLMQTVSLSSQFNDLASYPGLFGTDEERSANISPFTKWTGMLNRFEREMASPSSARIFNEWKANLHSIRSQDLRVMADKVNNLVNQIPYIVDSKNWGQSDYWATPVQFLRDGGDCEDFAIMKYIALRALGVPESRLRVAIVHDNEKNIPHAVLVVYTDEGSYILDNQIKRLVDGERPGRYRPIFSINRTAWWLHTQPSATVLASAE